MLEDEDDVRDGAGEQHDGGASEGASDEDEEDGISELEGLGVNLGSVLKARWPSGIAASQRQAH